MVKVEIIIDSKAKEQWQFNKLTREDATEKEIELAGLIEDANISIFRHIAKEAGIEIKETLIGCESGIVGRTKRDLIL